MCSSNSTQLICTFHTIKLRYQILFELGLQQPKMFWENASNFPAAPSTSEMTLWYLSLFSIQSFVFIPIFLRQSSYFFSLMWAMMGHSSALLLLSVLRHCLQFGLENIWPGKSRHCACTGEGHCPVRAAWGRWATSSVCTRVIDTSQTLTVALISCI